MNSFKDLGLSQEMVNVLDSMSFNSPTPIQAKTIPFALDGMDVLGSAQTGTGKTAAFGIPLVEKIKSSKHCDALVITPTRELAMQVLTQLRLLIDRDRNYQDVLLIGGESMDKQMKQLAKKPRIIVGTPGRINDHLRRGSLKLTNVHYLVLDEIDRMLDMGFSVQIEEIVKHLPESRQTLMFSATLPKSIASLANKYLNNPVRVSIGDESKPATNVKQDVIELAENQKYDRLLDELNEREGSIIVFVKTKYNADKMADRLKDLAHKVDAIHGDLRQSKRARVINDFRNKKKRILVATDVAARGLDIPHIEHVINYDLPQCPEDYIHRIGRTARAGAEGHAICFVTPSDRARWKLIDKMMNPEDYKSGAKNDNGPRRSTSSKPKEQKGRWDAKKRRSSSRNDFGGVKEPRRDDKPFRSRSDAPRREEKRNFERKERSFGEEEKSFKSKDRPFRSDDRKKPFRSDEKRPFKSKDRPFKSEERRSFKSKDDRFRGDDRKKSFRDGDRPFRKEDGGFKPKRKAFGSQENRSWNSDDKPRGKLGVKKKPLFKGQKDNYKFKRNKPE